MKEAKPVYSLTEAAELLGVDRRYVYNAVSLLDIPTFPFRRAGNAKGLTEAGFQKLKRAITKAAKQRAESAQPTAS